MLAHEPSYRRIVIRRRSPNAELLRHATGKDAPEEIFIRLSESFRDYLKPNSSDASRIEMKRPIGDPELDRLLATATQLGLRLPLHRADHPMQVSILDYTGFSEAEIEAADLVECQRFNPFIASSSAQFPAQITRIAADRYIKQCKKRTIGSLVNLYHLLAVRGEAKTALEAANLRGLVLLPLVPDSGGWASGIEPLYLVWSSHVFPPVECDLCVDGDYNLFRSTERDTCTLSRPCYLLDGFSVSPQLRYSHLDPSTFDVAITRELLGGASDHYRKLVFSQRARKVLERVDKRLKYTPVLMDA